MININFQGFESNCNNDIVVQSLEAAGIEQHGERANYEAIIAQLQAELQKEKAKTAHEVKLRINYYNKQCAAKKRLQSKVVNLQRKLDCLQEEKKSDSGDLNLYERMICDKDRQMSEKDQKIQQLENSHFEKDAKINKIQIQYQKLLDHCVHVKAEMDKFSYIG